MTPVHSAIAFIPVGVYLILMGALRLRSRPLITTGWRDTFALAVACVGLVAIGPMQLFFPVQAASRWHQWVWLALLMLYALGVLLILLSCKPRLIAYGLDLGQFKEALEAAAKSVDEESYWDGEVLNMPATNLQLAIDPTATSRVHQVVHFGLLNNLQAWLKLERAFVAQGRTLTCPRSAAGAPFVVAGVFLLLVVVWPMLNDPAEALAQLKKFINR
ncbi:MAG: hypothetical protein Aurels2KO_12360 [Aureliella sp.]